mgnify:CR=1 FL=1
MKTLKAMSESLLHALGYMYETLPTCDHYRELISILHNLTGWDYDDIRNKYGEYTYRQWGDLIAEHTPKF